MLVTLCWVVDSVRGFRLYIIWVLGALVTACGNPLLSLQCMKCPVQMWSQSRWDSYPALACLFVLSLSSCVNAASAATYVVLKRWERERSSSTADVLMPGKCSHPWHKTVPPCVPSLSIDFATISHKCGFIKLTDSSVLAIGSSLLISIPFSSALSFWPLSMSGPSPSFVLLLFLTPDSKRIPTALNHLRPHFFITVKPQSVQCSEDSMRFWLYDNLTVWRYHEGYNSKGF